MRTTTTTPVELKVLMNHIYELHKGVRHIGNNLKRGAFFAYPILAVGVIVWIMKLWIDSEWYYQGAAEEIGTDYAEGLRTLSSIWALLLVIALTLAVGFVGIRISAAKTESSDRFS